MNKYVKYRKGFTLIEMLARPAVAPRRGRRQWRAGFTLIEMLVVIAIIALLASILVPTVSSALESAKRVKCVSNLKNILLASRLYSEDNNDVLVPTRFEDKRTGNGKEFWNGALLGFYNQEKNLVHTRQKFSCSKWDEQSPTYTNWNWGYAMNDNPEYSESGSYSSNKTARVTIEEDGTLKGTYFYLSSIYSPSSRLMFCCATQWHVNRSNVEDFPAFDRHGEDRCNVGFFDGHVAMLPREAVIKAVRDP